MTLNTSYIILGFLMLGLLALLLFWRVPNSVPQPNIGEGTSTQQADLALGQYSERQGSSLPTAIPQQANPLANVPSASQAPLLPGCALYFSFIPAAKVVAPGGVINYSATLTNRGTETCQSASFSIYYADNETFLSAAPAANSAGYYWKVGDLGSGKSFSVQLSTKAAAQGDETSVNNEACATANNSDDVCADNVIFITDGAPAMSSVITALSPAIPNAGISAALSGVWGAAFTSKEFGTWIWEYPDTMSQAYVQSVTTAAAQNDFNTIYLTIDDYLTIAALPSGANKTAQQAAYFKSLAAFVTAAKSKGIAVDVEGGASTWGEPSERYKGYALIDFVSQYNVAYPSAKVRGLQYDVESYLLPSYENNKAAALQNFVDFIDASAKRMAQENPGAHFGVVVPHFYDSEVAWTPAITYNGQSEYTFTALLQALQQYPNSSLIVMAYRNFFAGTNGTEDIASAEIKEAATNNYSTKVIVAQETGHVDPAYVTFYGLSKADLHQALSDISDTFSKYSSFGGTAVHYLDPFLVLK